MTKCQSDSWCLWEQFEPWVGLAFIRPVLVIVSRMLQNLQQVWHSAPRTSFPPGVIGYGSKTWHWKRMPVDGEIGQMRAQGRPMCTWMIVGSSKNSLGSHSAPPTTSLTCGWRVSSSNLCLQVKAFSNTIAWVPCLKDLKGFAEQVLQIAWCFCIFERRLSSKNQLCHNRYSCHATRSYKETHMQLFAGVYM